MPSFEKLKLLIWKNYVLQKRHMKQTVFEIASPVIFSTLLILVRCLVEPQLKPASNYTAFFPTYLNLTGRDLGNISNIKKEGTIAFSPENPTLRNVTANAMKLVAIDNLGILALFFNPSMLPAPKGYANAKDMEHALTRPNAMKTTLLGVQFPDEWANMSKWPDNIQVTLRFPATMRTPILDHPLRLSWRTNLLYPVFPRAGPRWPDDNYGGKAPGYSSELFLAMQHSLSQEIIKQKTGKHIDTVIRLQRMPQLSYKDDMLLLALERFISMIIMLAFAYTFVNIVRVVTAEKELQLRETMQIMGLSTWLHWTAWFIKQFLFLLISVALMVLLLKIPFTKSANGDRFAVLTYVPWSVLMFFMILYMIASLAFAFMVSVFFSRANTAASFMGLAWLTTYSFFMLTQVLYEDISLTTKVLLSLISNTAMGYMFQLIVLAEGTSKGLQWKNFFKPISYHDPYQPGYVALMLILDAILYMLIALYVERIKPGQYGMPLPWYFPFTKSYWCPRRGRLGDNEFADLEYKDALLNVVHDEEPKGAKLGVDIKDLVKVYGHKKVVDHLNLRVYENEITVLLGHNGAGKTTTISMMTGMVPPTSGTAKINGYNVVTETRQARKFLGICPQHNVLFPYLTVAEHIKFYGRLKGVPSSQINAEINHFVKLLDLEDKRNTISKNLSGGQKRRLSVGAAMCGNSRVVLLDEPTSGLDPAARRQLWDLLQREKKGRTMILTTHFMDEADVLGDRIAIMSGGRLQCVGTPYFLKKHYGTGYKLTIVKDQHCNVQDITDFFKKYVPNIIENSNIGSELTYILTNEHVSKFPEMLKEFEDVRISLHVSSYGLSITSLEEVFMKVGAEDVESPHTLEDIQHPPPPTAPPHANNPVVMLVNTVKTTPRIGNDIPLNDVGAHAPLTPPTSPPPPLQPAWPPQQPNGQRKPTIDFSQIQKVTGAKLLKNHIRAMLLKRWYSAKGTKLVAFIQCLSPIINITISVFVARSWRFLNSLPPLNLSLESGFEATDTLLSHAANMTDGGFESKAMEAYKDYFHRASVNHPTMKLRDIGTNSLEQYYLELFAANEVKSRYENLVGATFSAGVIVGWFSNYGYHDPAISLNLVNDAVLRALMPNSSLQFINHPLPYNIESLVKIMASGSSMGFQFAFNIGFCMAFVTAFLVLFIVKERACGAKLLQRVTGVRPAVLWGCSFVWDWLWLAIVYVFIIVCLACFGESTLSTPAELGRVYLVLVAFSVAVIPLHYLASLRFTAPATGFAKMCFLNMFLGCMPFLIVEVLKLPEVGSPYYAEIFDYLFSPLPLYCLSRSFRELSVSSFTILACDEMCKQYNIMNCTRKIICNDLKIPLCCIRDDPFLRWDAPGIGRYIVTMFIVGIVLFIILMLIEYGVFKTIKKRLYRAYSLPPPTFDEDSDVATERRSVESMTHEQRASHSLVCNDLTKYYRHFLAVNRSTFVVHKGECFGLLGNNGAGKTSTFRMLTGDTTISCGDAFVHGHSVKYKIRDVHHHIGYCPQFDALLDNLTARETLKIFCLLRGIPVPVGTARAEQLAALLGFTRHYDKKIYQCSGGTKRKISAAVALLGDAPLVYMDEPTTGMDPASKRLVWSSISHAVESGRSVVLTSHSMEECEALCSRLTVMVRGRLHCLGPLQHLKSKFSQGYTLIVKSKAGTNSIDLSKIDDFVRTQFPNTRLAESYLGISTYYLEDRELPWWRVFAVMEEARGSLPIEDYSVSQTTLEQVFLKFTHMQIEESHEREADE